MLISIITPTCRPELLPVIEKCLARQTHTNLEWIIVAPLGTHGDIREKLAGGYTLLSDPPKKEGDFWSLCKAWNLAYSTAKGELIVNIQDGLWFPPDTLEKFASHFQTNPRVLISAVGHQYDQLDERGKPVNLVWEDPRIKEEAFRRVGPEEMEMCVCSVPRQAILDCGGVDEEYDKGPGCQEKEMCLRLRVLGYDNYLDQNIEYRAIHHPRLTSDWDEKYWEVTAPMFKRHVKDMLDGVRPLNVESLKAYNQNSLNL